MDPSASPTSSSSCSYGKLGGAALEGPLVGLLMEDATLLDETSPFLSSNFAPQAPWEIIVAIVRETDHPPTLASFSLVCYDLLKIAGPLLWRDLLIDSYFKMACLFHEPSPPLPTSSRLQPHLGLHLLFNLHFFLPPPPPNPLLLEQHPHLSLPRSRLPNPSFPLRINHLTLEWGSNQPILAQLHVFAHLDPKFYSQIFAPQDEDVLFEVVSTEFHWIAGAFMRWTRLEKMSSRCVLLCYGSGRSYLPFTGEFMEALPNHVFDFRRSREGFAEVPAMRRGVFDEVEAWRGLVRELGARGVGECTQIGDGGIEILVSEKGDEDRLLAALSLLDGVQRRKYKVTLGKGFDISHHVGPDTRRPGPPKPAPIVFGGP